jgi:hypothetical protein
MMLQQEEEVKHRLGSFVSKHDSMGYNKVCTRRIAMKKTEKLQEVKIEPETKIQSVPVNNSP